MKRSTLHQYAALKQFLFKVELTRERDATGYHLRMQFMHRRRPILRISFPPVQSEDDIISIEQNGIPSPQFYIAIARAFQSGSEQERLGLNTIIEHHSDFTIGASVSDETTLKSFSNFSKALIQFLEDQQDVLMTFFSDVPTLCANVVKLESDAHQEKHYLGKTIDYERDQARQAEIFSEIADFISSGWLGDPAHKKRRIVTFVTEYWLNLYDFDRAAEYIDQAALKSPSVSAISAMYKYGHVIGFLFILSSATLINSWNGFHQQTRTLLAGAIAVTLVSVLLWLIVNGDVRVLRLSLPRMAAAVAAGFAILLPEPSTWHWGTELGIWRAVGIVAATYLGALVYLFLEVDTTQKFLAGKTEWDVWKSTLKLFAIGVSQSFAVGALAFVLLSPLVSPPTSTFSWALEIPQFGSVTVSIRNTVVLLFVWSGIALFVGAFIELIWESKRITDAI